MDPLDIALAFADRLAADSRAALRASARIIKAEAGSPLIAPGDAVSGAYFVGSGSIRVYYLSEDGRQGTLYRILPGQTCLLGINSLFRASPYPAHAEAGAEGVCLARIDGSAARALAHTDPAFLAVLFDQLSARLFELMTAMELSMRLSLDARLARLLVELADKGGTVHSSQATLADQLGTSREVIARLLRAMTRRGAIERRYCSIQLLDKVALLRGPTRP